MPSADLFCGDDSFIHLEDDWRRGLGWWLVNVDRRSRLSVSDAMRLVHHGLRLEVVLETQELVRHLETTAGHHLPAQARCDAIDALRNELAAASAEHQNDPETSLRLFPMVAALTYTG